MNASSTPSEQTREQAVRLEMEGEARSGVWRSCLDGNVQGNGNPMKLNLKFWRDTIHPSENHHQLFLSRDERDNCSPSPIMIVRRTPFLMHMD